MSEECTECGSIAGHLWFCPYSALDAQVGQRYAPDDNAPLKSGIAAALARGEKVSAKNEELRRTVARLEAEIEVLKSALMSAEKGEKE